MSKMEVIIMILTTKYHEKNIYLFSNEKRIKLDHNKMVFYKNTWKREEHEKLAKERRAKLREKGILK